MRHGTLPESRLGIPGAFSNRVGSFTNRFGASFFRAGGDEAPPSNGTVTCPTVMDSFLRSVGDALAAHGFSEVQVDGKTALFDKCRVVLDQSGAVPNRRAFFVPGRIEVLGKHTDYSGGGAWSARSTRA